MSLTKGQLKDLETVMYFIPSDFKNTPITDKNIKMFFENSEKGWHKELSKIKLFGFYSKERLGKIMKDMEFKTVPNFTNYDENGKFIYPPILCESGINIDEFLSYQGYFLLLEGKRWRGIHIHELYEPGVLEGSVPYFTLLGGFCGKKRNWFMRLFKDTYKSDPMPRAVVDFLKREMFKGIHSEIIEKKYQEILCH